MQDAHVKLRIQITVEVGHSDSDRAGDPSSRKPQSSGHVEMSTDNIFSKTKLRGDEQWNGGVLRDVLGC